MANNSYRKSELDRVDANGEYPAKLKIASDDGDTRWLNITATEFEQIKAVMLDYRNGDDESEQPAEAPEVATLRSMLSTAKQTLQHDRERLEEYRQDHISHSYAEDTAAQIKRTEKKLIAGAERIKALELAVSKLS